ncbi:MAG TPA: hypothetical protein VGF16_07065 [Bryobacteraceae bacterium]|jgi:hypothetical protein
MGLKRISAPPAGLRVTATVQRVGKLKKVSARDTNAAGADLRITLTGGTVKTRVRAGFVVSLNTKPGEEGTAQLIDETMGSPPVPARKSRNTYVFEPVQFEEPGPTASRVFRITNVRANVSGLSSGSASATPVVASISISGITGISLVHAEQDIASVEPAAR